MVVNKVKTAELFHINSAGEVCLNLYYGCSEVCPFCYWQADSEWQGQITAYTDAADRLKEEIGGIPEHTEIILGYKGNPYCSLEKDLALTRECLKILLDKKMKVMVSSSCDNDIILRDLDILSEFGDDVRVVMEMTRLDVVKQFNETKTHLSFDVVNTLKHSGINICVTISPVLPGITDVERMAAALFGIPVYITALDIRPGTIWNEKTLEYIERNYTDLLPCYEQIARTGTDPYFESLKNKYDGSGQIRAGLPFWDEIPVE